MKAEFILTLLIFFLSCNNQKQPVQSSATIKGEEGERIDSILTPYLIELRNLTDNQAGLAVGISKGGKTIYTRYFGYSDIENQIKVNATTKFHIASLSKPLVAMAIMKLIEKGKLNLDDKIIEIIPEFLMNEDGYDSITIKHILTHTSGIPANIKPNDWTEPSFGDMALEETITILKNQSLEFDPGTSYSYSNSAFDLLGVVIERLSGKRFSEFMTDEILDPSGMTNSVYTKTGEGIPSDWAKCYSYGLETIQWAPYPYNERLLPSAGLVTTLPDMLTWANFNLSKGTVNGHVVLEKEYYQPITTGQAATPWGDSIGLSWFLQSYLEKPIIMHQGQDTGFESLIYLYPEEDISIVVMANRDFSRTARIINAASEVLFSNQPKDYSVSAVYKFTNIYKAEGINKAKREWELLRGDTTDIYTVNDDDILTTGAIEENAKNWKETKEILTFYNELNPNSTYSWRLLGNANLNLGDTISALANYNKCLEINPNYTKARMAIDALVAN